MKRLSILTALVCLAATVSVQGCSTAQLQGFNQQLASLNNGIASAANPGPPMPQPTAAQQQQLLAQLSWRYKPQSGRQRRPCGRSCNSWPVTRA